MNIIEVVYTHDIEGENNVGAAQMRNNALAIKLQYWTCSIAPCKVISHNLNLLNFEIIPLLLFLIALFIVFALPAIEILRIVALSCS